MPAPAAAATINQARNTNSAAPMATPSHTNTRAFSGCMMATNGMTVMTASMTSVSSVSHPGMAVRRSHIPMARAAPKTRPNSRSRLATTRAPGTSPSPSALPISD